MNRDLMMASSALASLALGATPRAVAAAPRADAADPKVLFAELRSAHEEFKNTIEANLGKKADDALVNSKLESISNSMSTIEAAIEEANRKIAAAQLGGTGGLANQEHTDQINAYLRSGTAPTVQAAMSEGTDTAGGFLVPVEWDRTITDKLKQRSPIRENSQVITVGDRGFLRVYNDGVIGSGWVGETAARPETGTPGLTTLQFDLGEIYASPAVTQRMLDDAGFNLEQWLTSEVDSEFAIQENLAFLNGNGTNKPFGVLTYVTGAANAAKHPFGAITVTGAAAAADIATDEILTLISSLPSEREMGAKLFMNRSTLFLLRKKKDTTGQYIWQPSYVEGQPSTLCGYPVVEVSGMPAATLGNVSILFGNMEQTYLVIERSGTQVLRDPFTNKPYVHFYTTKRVGGGVQNPEYMKALKQA